ncbi:uncharacterized protein RCO7_00275 [Rhynchosporium graminicola]|uniref:DUF7730 domain-containing protein n=1 Tax=Rhynchosporium graminicola TaxID=2792576 RepID=A0A1E1KH94_9HELO|nr:uncharacterized protein RCO7_00275 [Rhynchosporium commune]
MSVRLVQKEPHPTGLTGRTVFGALNFLTGRSRPLPDAPKVPSSRRWQSMGLPANRQARSNYQPPPITTSLPKRTRAISPSRHGKENLPHPLYDQEESPLFDLPPEVLDMIIEYTIGNQHLHILRRPGGKLGYKECAQAGSSDRGTCWERCRGSKLDTGRYNRSGEEREDLMVLLQTCRKFYVSAVRFLYESTTFDFDSMESFITFSTSVLPHRFDSIRHLSFDFRFATSRFHFEGTPQIDWPRWERMWRVVGSIKSLQTLRARIAWHKEDPGVVTERRWLDELIQVTGLKVFELELPGLLEAEKKVDEGFRRAHGEWEFVVTRRQSMI